jgi:type IV secretory pathway VirJ component
MFFDRLQSSSRVFASFCLLVMSSLVVMTATVAHAQRVLPAIKTAEFGDVAIVAPDEAAQGMVFLFSGGEGIQEDDRNAIHALVKAGMAVVVIDSSIALSKLSTLKTERKCVDLPGPLEWLSHNAQADLHFKHYDEPVLVGRGAGATLVYVALAQAPPLSFAGGTSIDFNPQLPIKQALCDLQTSSSTLAGQRLQANASLPKPWLVGKQLKSSAADSQSFIDKIATNNHDKVIKLSGNDLSKLYLDGVRMLLKPASTNGSASVTDLPLVEVAAPSTDPVNGRVLVLIYSGDGGWRDIDKTLGDYFKEQKFAVVGIDCLRYLWTERKPAQLAADLSRILNYYRNQWHVEKVVLMGYSFGANIIPFAYNRLPQVQQGDILLLSLLAPERATDFTISVFGWVGAGPSDEALPLGPEVAQIQAHKLQCVYGEEEAEDSLCTTAVMRRAEVIKRPGSHHFDEDYAALGRLLLSGLKQRLNEH